MTLHPKEVLVDISSICPHRCVYCYHQYYKKHIPKMMSDEMFYKIIDILAAEGVTKIHPYMSGEPLTHPSVWDFLSYIAHKGMHCGIASKFSVPVDWDQFKKIMDTYTTLHKKIHWGVEVSGTTVSITKAITITGNHELIWQNLAVLGNLINTPGHTSEVGCKTVITRHNQHQLTEIKETLLGLGLKNWRSVHAGFYMLTKPDVSLEQVEDMLPDNTGRCRIAIKDGEVQTEKPQSKCTLCLRPVISPSGNVGLCCHDMLYEYNFGNVLETGSLLEILNSSEYLAGREKALNRQMALCQGCN